MQKLLLTLCFTLIAGWFTAVLAQEPNVTQYYHTPFLTNPGMIGVMEQANVVLNHRSQTLEAGQTYTTSSASGYYPIAVGNHRLGIGASFLSDRVADFMATNGGLLGTAYSIQLSRQHELGLGAQVGFFNRKLSSSFAYTTDSQFQNGSFNADAPTGEVLAGQSRSFMTLTTGLFWQMRDLSQRPVAFAGIAIFNVNQPNVGFEEAVSLPTSLKATAGLRVFQGERLSVMPNMRWLYGSDVRLLSTGSWLRYNLSESVEYPQQIGLGAWYNSNETSILALEYTRSRFLVGLSYDIPLVSELSTLQRGGIFEITLSLRVGNKPKRRMRVASKDNKTILPVAPKETVPSTEAEPVEKNIEKSVPPKKSIATERKPDALPSAAIPQERVPLTEADRSILDKTVQFTLNTHALTTNSKAFLDKVAEMLLRNQTIKVSLVGHTCSIGTTADNQRLSVQRAKVVEQYLVEQQGIDRERVIIVGKGESEPIADNNTEAGRVRNRRVAFEITNE